MDKNKAVYREIEVLNSRCRMVETLNLVDFYKICFISVWVTRW